MSDLSISGNSPIGYARLTRAAALLAAAGALFAIYLLARPYAPGGGQDTVKEFASGWWLVAHSAAMIGFVAVSWAIGEAAAGLAGGPGARLLRWAGGFFAGGTALVLPYYGAETIALHAIGRQEVADPEGLS